MLREYGTIVDLVKEGTELTRFKISNDKRPCTSLYERDRSKWKKSTVNMRKANVFPPAPPHVVAVLGEAGAAELRQLIYWKVAIKQRLNPLAYDTIPVWYAYQEDDPPNALLQFKTDWSNLSVRPPSVGIINYTTSEYKYKCRYCDDRYVM